MGQGAVSTMRIVPSLNELEDGDAGPGLGLEADTIAELTFPGGEERLAHRVVVAVAHGAHGRTYSGGLAALSNGQQGGDNLGRSGE